MDIYVVSLLHFNLQYVAGGLEGYLEDWPADEQSVEDQIIVESFEPVLDMLLAHPTWAMDLELQGYMVDVIADRHPGVLDKLQTLTASGQVELVSFHWSDQLWTAFPWRDQQWSLELTAQSFQDNGLPLARVVFTQEGQFGEGMLEHMPDYGYDIALLPRNLGSYMWGQSADQTLYDFDGVTVIPTNSLTSADGSYQVQWSFVDDGELLATGGIDPYFGPLFVTNLDAIADFEADMQAREDAGAHISTVSAYVDAVHDRGTVPFPGIIDGSWQPSGSDNMYRWLGGGGLFADDEADSAVRVVQHDAGWTLAAAELLEPDAPELPDAWRQLLLAEVSDASGWNPISNEVQYGFEHAAAALDAITTVVERACADRGAISSLAVDLASGDVLVDDAPDEPAWQETSAPAGVSPQVGEDRAATVTWYQDPATPDVLRLDVSFDYYDATPELTLAWDAAVYGTVPALTSRVQEVSAADVGDDGIGLALPLGLARLAEGLWLVEDHRYQHLAGVFSRADGSLRFIDETAPVDAHTWSFRLVEGDADRALAVAQALNEDPVVTLSCPAAGTDTGGMDTGSTATTGGGCGCATGSRGGLAGVFGALLALVAVGRRR